MKRVGFFGNFYYSFLGLIDNFLVDFVIFERKKENSDIIEYCKMHKIDYFFVSSNIEILNIIKRYSDIDFYVVASFGLIFNKEILNKPNNCIINIHPGILPKYRGRHPLPQAILNKDKYMGITAHVMNLDIDKGKIINLIQMKINYKKDYKYNELKLLNELKHFTVNAIFNYCKDIEIDRTNHKEFYYKPLDKIILDKIMSIKKLEDL